LWAEPFRVAVLGLNEITGLTVSHTALLSTEFLISFSRFGSGGGGGGGGEGHSGCGGVGGDLNISPNTAIPPSHLVIMNTVYSKKKTT